MHTALFVRYAIAAVILVVAVFFGLFTYMESKETGQIARLGVSKTQRIAERFNDTIETLGIDVEALAKSPTLQRFINDGQEVDRVQTEQVFVATSAIWKAFSQIRYLDETGVERIRVDRVNDVVTVIPTDRLQDKSGRTYFEDSVSLPEGSLYFSRLDLNVENGRIEMPWKPMIRVAAPVFDDQGERAGIVVINVLADYLLNHLKAEENSDDDKRESLMLLSEDGSWLFGASTEKMWDFMLHHGNTFAAEFPNVWEKVSAQENGSIWDGDTLYAFATIRPDRKSGLRSSFASQNVNVVSAVNYWKVVDVVRRTGLPVYAQSIWWATFITVLLASVWLSWFISSMNSKRRSAELREEATITRSREVLNRTNAFIQVWGNDGRVLFANERYCRLVGKPVHALVGESAEETVPEALKNVLKFKPEPGRTENGILVQNEEVVLEGEGAMRHFLVDQFPLRGVDGKEDSQCAIGVEVTELKEIEESLIAAKEEAIEATMAKSRFVANMSHELRTPLNAIIGYAEILDEEAEDDGLDEYRSDLQRILDAGRHLLSLINDILDLSKIEAGKMELHIEVFTLEQILSGVISTVKPMVESNGNTFVVDCDVMDTKMQSDDTRLRQILYNLLSNAAKFSADGEVSLVVKEKDMDGIAGLEMTVNDSGIGMSREQIDRLFSEFSQADSSISKRFQGTGLGLAICKRLANLLGGDISVKSEEGVGSSFTLWTPIQVGQEKQSKLEKARKAGGFDAGSQSTSVPTVREGVSILIIDDDTNSRELLARYITSVGMQVSTAPNGIDGIMRARQTMPDAIVLDVFMDELDGWDVLRQLKKDPELCSIPVIMCSISDEQKKATSLGAVEMLTKPVNRDEFLNAVRRHSKGGRVGKILVVDDLEENRAVITSQLSGIGQDFIEAESGRDALAKLADINSLHSVILDLMMPEMDGFEFLEKFRSDPRWRDVPVFVLTAMTLTREERSILAASTQSVISRSGQSIEDVLGEIMADLERQLGITK